MDRIEVDVRKRPCPQPVVEARKALLETRALEVTVLVDGDAPAENVARMARHMGCEVALEDRRDHVAVVLSRSSAGSGERTTSPSAGCAAAVDEPNVAVFFASSTVGHGDDELGRILMVAFVKTLKTLSPRPRALLFMNGGVKLVAEGSELVEPFRELAAEGVELLVCGTCLDFFRIKESLAVGKVSNMFEIGSRLLSASNVVRP